MAEVSGAAWYKVWFHTRFPFFLCSSDHWFPFSCSDTPNLSLSQDLCAWLFFPQIFTSLAPSPHPDYNSDVRFSGRPFLTLLLKVIHLWVIFLHCVFQTVGYGPLLVGIEISLMGLFFFFFFLRNGDAQLLKKKLFIFGCAGSLWLCGPSLVAESRELLLVAVSGLLVAVASPVAKHRH